MSDSIDSRLDGLDSCWVRPLTANIVNGAIELELPVALLGTDADALLVAPVYTSEERALVLDVGLKPTRVHVSHLAQLLPHRTAIAFDFGHPDQQLVSYDVWCARAEPSEPNQGTVSVNGWIAALPEDE